MAIDLLPGGSVADGASGGALPDGSVLVATSGGGGGGPDASVPAGTGTSTGSGTGGAATGSGATTGSFHFDACKNNTETAVLDGIAVNWAWHGVGAVGAATSITNGAGTMTASGMTISGLPAGFGYGVFRTADGTVVGYQEGTVA